jgi:inhibitor of cysteine peptidase
MMVRRLALVVVVLAGLSACGQSTAAPARDRVVSESSNEQTIHLDVGATLAIELHETPGTGYAWRTTARPNARILRLLSARYVPAPHHPGIVGTGGEAVWRYRAQHPGRASTLIKLFPPGARRKAVRAFHLTVVVGHRPR